MGTPAQPTFDASEVAHLPSLSATDPLDGDVARSLESRLNATAASKDADLLSKNGKVAEFRPSKRANAEPYIREARASIRSKLREDWAFPIPLGVQPVLYVNEECCEWRERESDEDNVITASVTRSGSEDILLDGEDGGSARKKRKTEALLDETEWNEGLRWFMAQRDTWTGAKSKRSIPGIAANYDAYVDTNTPASPPHKIANRSSQSSTLSSTSIGSSSMSSATSAAAMSAGSVTSLPITESPSPLPQTPQSFPLPASTPTDPVSTATRIPCEVLIPIPPPILPPTHPVRSSITPKAYQALYSRIVVQGMTPTIPINLKDMIPAIVDGWKRDGEWPPKPTLPEGVALAPQKPGQPAASAGKQLVGRGVGRFKRALGLSTEEQQRTEKQPGLRE